MPRGPGGTRHQDVLTQHQNVSLGTARRIVQECPESARPERDTDLRRSREQQRPTAGAAADSEHRSG